MKNLTHEDVELATYDYMNKNPGKKAKYVLMDKKTYKKYTEAFLSKERIVLNSQSEEAGESKIGNVNLVSSLAYSVVVEILPVNTKTFLFEVVG